MRHGESEANVDKIIVSDPAVGCDNYGLSQMGQQQVKKSAEGSLLKKETHIFCSDFLRAKETATIVQSIIQSTHVIEVTAALRERFFGELNGLPDSHYENVWSQDKKCADHQEYGVESANQVVTRASQLIQELENKYNDENVLLVAHGDVLQLLQTWFQGVPATEHRDLPHLVTAEIRLLNPY